MATIDKLFRPSASYFILLAQNKVTKQKGTPSRLFPALLNFMGVNRKLANKITWLKQPLAENSHEAEQRRRGSRGFKVKGGDVSWISVYSEYFQIQSSRVGNLFAHAVKC
ncbi:hypothetical protein [Methylotenera sp.]|uniref:hypothetical protein n=1 Tax=Methylotenera sp. TaxID=2051956 RepID=UPI00248A199F|nr:hypothetical protein [Methylotenera sp.]MDI1361286.1 hypothetical protein [Methylotenera sp.]